MGQEMKATNIQVATVYSALANGGYVIEPKIINDDLPVSIVRKAANINDINKIISALKMVVSTGTASSDKDDFCLFGKTGTAQVKRITEAERKLDLKTEQIPYRERDHAWYIAFGPYKNPRYSISILVEHGGSGSATAAPIAKKLFKVVIDRHELREQIKTRKLIKI